ncbi:phosphoglycerate kinase [Flexistipes sp.]|uniref:phosphoglycerate kinase n=1 Tax=Flexistipes sp. TaxID=3088135 RepID=UPI002E1EC9AC|nr:phosphoglycerate kinase [Flexistipes sp.]
MLEGVKFINEINLKSKKVFIRVDFNVPVKNGVIQDATRIDEAMETISYAKNEGAKVMLASHMGRPKGSVKPELSLKPVAEYITGRYFYTYFAEDCIGESVEKNVNNMEDGEVLLLENLRFHPEEKANDPDFAAKLCEFCDVYINDAFGSSHRAHSSVDGLPRKCSEKAAGFLMKRELEYFDMLVNNPERPFYAVLGGAKASDKIGVIESLMDKVDKILIGGAMAYTFLNVLGVKTGKSLVENGLFDTVEKIIRKADNKNMKIVLPVDHICSTEFNGKPEYVDERDIPDNLMGLDIGNKTAELYKKELSDAKIVMWNGPMGVFESKDFCKGTFDIAEYLGSLGAVTVVGGGDSVSAVKKAGVSGSINHISTGGGASLELLEKGTLAGIEALKT